MAQVMLISFCVELYSTKQVILLADLKPCPFCGDEASLCCEEHVIHNRHYLYYFVVCESCGASSRINSIDKLLVFPAEQWDNAASRRAEECWNNRNEKGS